MNEHDEQQQTALLAYQFWVERGWPVGSPDEDWYRAERPLQSRQLEGVAPDAAGAPAQIVGDPADGAPGSRLAVAISSR